LDRVTQNGPTDNSGRRGRFDSPVDDNQAAVARATARRSAANMRAVPCLQPRDEAEHVPVCSAYAQLSQQPQSVSSYQPATSNQIITGHFSGPGIAVDPVCKSVSRCIFLVVLCDNTGDERVPMYVFGIVDKGDRF